MDNAVTDLPDVHFLMKWFSHHAFFEAFAPKDNTTPILQSHGYENNNSSIAFFSTVFLISDDVRNNLIQKKNIMTLK